MGAKHTSIPWDVRWPLMVNDRITDPRTIIYSADAPFRVIAFVDRTLPPEEREANARLIVNAVNERKELLEALRAVKSAGDAYWTEAFSQAQEKVKNALLKAECFED